MKTIYIEKNLIDHPRAKAILSRFKENIEIIECEHYGEVFNPKQQNFRIQKQNPALILAEKKGKLVLPTPEGFGIGGEQNYYFSHMQNCPYDCRYCFLQGMYQSANYVLFLNYEDFMQEIKATAETAKEFSYFFSGYDADSLAYEPVSQFLTSFLPFFRENPKAILELRSKSANVRSLLSEEPFDNCVCAFSFTPEAISKKIEKGVPSVEKRIEAAKKVSEHGWKVGLRFDPIVYDTNYKEQYRELLLDIFSKIDVKMIHSVSVGPLRFPKKMYQKIRDLYPDEGMLATKLIKRESQISYSKALEEEMTNFVKNEVGKYLSETIVFQCYTDSALSS